MKRLLTVFAMAVAAMAFAVGAKAQISVGAGYGLATHVAKTLSSDDEVLDDEDEGLSGFYINASYNLDLLSRKWGVLSLQPGLTYSYYGFSDSEREDNFGTTTFTKTSLNEHYLDVPVNVKYSYDLLPGTLKLSAFAGPVFSFGLSSTAVARVDVGDDWTKIRTNNYTGTVTTKGNVAGVSLDSTEKGSGTGYRMFDLKLGLGIAATVIDKLEVKFAYNIGLLDRMEAQNVRLNTNVFTVGVAWNF